MLLVAAGGYQRSSQVVDKLTETFDFAACVAGLFVGEYKRIMEKCMQNILHIGKEYTSSELISSVLCGYQSVEKHELSVHIKEFIDELLNDNETNSDRINLIIWMANVFHPIHTIKSGDSGRK